MNKYSKKIINFIKKNNFQLYDVDISTNEFILEILQICKKINNIDISNITNNYTISKISKLHNKNEYPQLYYLFIEYKPHDISTFSDFITYYSLNQHNLHSSSIENDIQYDQKLMELYNNIYYPNNDRTELVNIFYNNFQSIDIIQEIESHDLIHIVLNIKRIRLSIYYYNDNINIQEYISNILKIIFLIDEIAKFYKIVVNDYDVIIFLGLNKKYLFNNKKILTPMNINSGATLLSSYVSLWRMEEYEKVLIHELLHYIGIDYHLFNNHEFSDKIKNIFNINGINHINESYNECVAAIINMCWKSINYNFNINTVYHFETKFLIFQTNKIIRFFNGNNAYDLCNIKISQTTSALSYIIIKTILFLNIANILQIIKMCNIKLNTNDKIKEYEQLLLQLITEKKYLDILQQNFHIFPSINKTNKIKFIERTMRMSVF